MRFNPLSDRTAIALVLAFVLVSLWQLQQIHVHALGAFITSDWLINYHAGFVRRGLPGSAITALAAASGLDPALLATGLQALLYAMFGALLGLALRGRRLPLWYWLLLLSPATLLFSVHDAGGVGRKEILHYIALLAFALLARRPCVPRFWVALFPALAVAITLSHELFVFFSPYFLAVAALARDRRFGWTTAALMVLASTLTAALAVGLGATIDGVETCVQLHRLGMDGRLCGGILSLQPLGLAETLSANLHAVRALDFQRIYPLALALTLVPLLFIDLGPQRPRVLLAGLALFVVTIPLFAVAADWGRWISIHACSALIVASTVLRRDASAHEAPWPPGSRAVQWALLAGHALLWSFPHTGGTPLVIGAPGLLR